MWIGFKRKTFTALLLPSTDPHGPLLTGCHVISLSKILYMKIKLISKSTVRLKVQALDYVCMFLVSVIVQLYICIEGDTEVMKCWVCLWQVLVSGWRRHVHGGWSSVGWRSAVSPATERALHRENCQTLRVWNLPRSALLTQQTHHPQVNPSLIIREIMAVEHPSIYTHYPHVLSHVVEAGACVSATEHCCLPKEMKWIVCTQFNSTIRTTDSQI